MLLVPKHDYRTPLEKSLNVDPALVVERGETQAQRDKRKAIEALAKLGVRVIELPRGRWRVIPEYPADATDADKAAIDQVCENFMRRVAYGRD